MQSRPILSVLFAVFTDSYFLRFNLFFCLDFEEY